MLKKKKAMKLKKRIKFTKNRKMAQDKIYFSELKHYNQIFFSVMLTNQAEHETVTNNRI